MKFEGTRSCTHCKGSGKRYSAEQAASDPFYAKYANQPCSFCKGTPDVAGPDVDVILAAIKGRKGLRSKAPDYWGPNFNVTNIRSYYVWRMARFHGGQDVTMPITATTLISGDPWIKELDAIADLVATKVYGTDRAAAYRWGNALGYSIPVPSNQPVSAFSGGPVLLDSNKPDYEQPELW